MQRAKGVFHALDLSRSDIAVIAQRLTPYFLSSSLGTPPKATGGSGGRTVAAVNLPPGDQTTRALVAGTVTWKFTTEFKNPPIIGISAVGAPPTSGGVPAVLYIHANAANAVVITSTINTDSRVLHLTATGNPD